MPGPAIGAAAARIGLGLKRIKNLLGFATGDDDGGSNAAVVAKLASVILLLIKIHVIITVFILSFWTAVAYFSKDIFGWVMETLLKLSAKALEWAGVEMSAADMLATFNSLPPVVLDLWAMLGLFSSLQIIFTAYSINMALRSIPFIGNMFRG